MAARRLEESTAFAAFLDEHQGKSLLRFLTCGSVDDGKSTLIGRLLYDSKRLFEDQLATLRSDSKKFGTTGGDIDFALLVDGLVAEREQGITIDVAYRYFATDRRRFIVADTPGHEQYTRNMATGASNSDLAVLLVDARNGILTQTRRHAYIVSLLGIRHAVLAVNKIDLVGFDEQRFVEIREAFAEFAAPFGFERIVAIPMSARFGDNVIDRSDNTPWYSGPTLLEHLENVTVETGEAAKPFRFPVQWVNRPDLTFRGYTGTLAAGRIRPGDEVVVARTGQTARVARIVTLDGDLMAAEADAAVTLTLDSEIDASRGDVFAAPENRPDVSDQIAAHLIWMGEEPLLPGRPYLLKSGTRTVGAAVSDLKHQVDVESFKLLAAKTLTLNDIGLVNISLSEPIAFDLYDDNKTTGSFILIDRFTNATVAAGMIRFGLRRATNIHWQALTVDRRARADLKGQKPCILWFTGLSGAGKSTIANLVEAKLLLMGRHTYLLDGDNVRHGLNRDLGFTDADRVENIRRVAEAAKLFVDSGLIVLVSFISPFRSERAMARELVGEEEFIEVFVDAPLSVVESRDPKGLYKKARAGEIKHFTGIDSPYEAPLRPDIRLDTSTSADANELAERVIEALRTGGYIGKS
jgi:bifunctional enzyme CysN/CysC